MLACSEVTRLYATDEIRRASFRRRLAVRLHLLMCEHCTRYVRELRLIAAAARRHFTQTTSEPRRFAALEQAIKEAIRRPL